MQATYLSILGAVLAVVAPVVAQVTPSVKPAATNAPADTAAGSDKAVWESSSDAARAALNDVHRDVYGLARNGVRTVDALFARANERPAAVPPCPFRIGILGEASSCAGTNAGASFAVLLTGDADITLPSAERRLKLTITTMDPTALPGRGPEDIRNILRLALDKRWTESIDTSIGIRLKLRDPLYANTSIGREYGIEGVRIFLKEKVFWTMPDGFGELSSVVADFWHNRFDYRYSASVKWSEGKLDEDNALDNGQHGWEWEQVASCSYVKELMDERDLGRWVRGEDIAKGMTLRCSVGGGPESVDRCVAGVDFRDRLFDKWVFSLVSPQVEWSDRNDWEPDYRLTFGVILLFQEPD